MREDETEDRREGLRNHRAGDVRVPEGGRRAELSLLALGRNRTEQRTVQDAASGRRVLIYLVGSGPGDPGLFTIKGVERLKEADVVVYDRLAPETLLGYAR